MTRRPFTQQGTTLPYRQESVEVVVPVYNEEDDLPRDIPILCDYLATYFPYRWSIVIADNASTDGYFSRRRGARSCLLSRLHLAPRQERAWESPKGCLAGLLGRHRSLHGR
jgi:hypothetical protein